MGCSNQVGDRRDIIKATIGGCLVDHRSEGSSVTVSFRPECGELAFGKGPGYILNVMHSHAYERISPSIPQTRVLDECGPRDVVVSIRMHERPKLVIALLRAPGDLLAQISRRISMQGDALRGSSRFNPY